MFNRIRARLRKRRHRDLAEVEALRRQAELERRKAEAGMAEQQQRVGSAVEWFPGGWS
jgi:hypothetical protein